jgi:cold shock CspA family protein
MPTGKVKTYDPDRGFGFIRQDAGGVIFFHVSELRVDPLDIKRGDLVEYEIRTARDGRILATGVARHTQ